MTTTTLRLPNELKAQLVRLAEEAGTTPHALMLEMLAEQARQHDARAAFEAETQRRWKTMLRTGEYLEMDDLSQYAQALARGQTPARPPVRRMAAGDLAALRGRAKRGAA